MKLSDLPPSRHFVLWLLAVLVTAGVDAPRAEAQTKPSPPPVAPSLVINAQSVVATEVTPGGEVAWLAVERRPRTYYQDVVVHREVTVADAHGEARLELGGDVAPHSIWTAIDLATGAVVGAVPQSYPDRRVPFSSEGLLNADGTGASRFSHPLRSAELLFVRPGQGVWMGQAEDGKGGDADGVTDGRVAFQLSELVPLGEGAGPPAELAEGDTVVALDPSGMRYSLGRVEARSGSQGGSANGGAQ